MVLDKEYYMKINESEHKFYGKLNEIRLQMGLSPVKVPFFAPKESTELKDYALVVPVKLPFDARGELDSNSYTSEILDIPSNLGDDCGRRDRSLDSSTYEPSRYSTERSHKTGFQEVEASAKQMLQTFQQIRADFQEWCEEVEAREEVEASTQVIIPSKVTQVGDGSFLNAHNLLGEMPTEDFSGKSSGIDPTPLNLEPQIEIAGNGRVQADFFPFEISELQQAVVKEEFVEVDSCGLVENRIQEDIPLVTNLYRYLKHLKVTLDPLEVDMLKLVDNGKDSIDVRLGDFQLNSVNFLVKFFAHQVFVKMSKKEWNDVAESGKLLSTLGHFFYLVDSSRSFVFDPGKSNNFLLHNGSLEALVTLVFDPGGDQVLLRFVLEIFLLAKLVLEMEKCGS